MLVGVVGKAGPNPDIHVPLHRYAPGLGKAVGPSRLRCYALGNGTVTFGSAPGNVLQHLRGL